MSDRIPPFLSASPPPFEEDTQTYDDEDDFGDFHDFSSATAISSDTSLVISGSEFRPIDVADSFTDHGSSSVCEVLHPTAVFPNELPTEAPLEANNDSECHDERDLDSNIAAGLEVAKPEPATEILESDDGAYEVEDFRSTTGSESNTVDETADAFGTFVCSGSVVNQTVTDVDLEDCSTSETEIAKSCSAVYTSNVQVEDSNLTDMLPESVEGCESNLSKKETNRKSDVAALDTLSDHKSSLETTAEQLNQSEHMENISCMPLPVKDGPESSDGFNAVCDVNPVVSSQYNIETSDDNNASVDADFTNDNESDDDFAGFEMASAPTINSMPAAWSYNTDETLNSARSEETSAVVFNHMGHNAEVVETLPVTATAIETENCDFPTVESDTNQQAVVADASAELVSSLAFPVDCKPPLSYEQQVSNKQDSFDDEYDDFEEFKSAEQVASCKTEVLMDSKDSSAGQWAAFGSSEPVDDGDDWAAFQETNATNTDSMPSATHPEEIQDSPALSSGSSQEQLVRALTNCFLVPTGEETALPVSSLQRLLNGVSQPDTAVKASSSAPHSISVWNDLRVMENTVALKYQWSGSRSNDLLLKAVNVDARNILIGHRNKSSAPVFASSLGLLEPKKATVVQPKIMSSANTVPNHNTAHKNAVHDGRLGRFTGQSVGSVSAKKPERDLLDVLELSDGGPTAQSNVKVLPKPFDNILASITSSSKVQTSQTSRKVNHTAEPLSAEAAAVLAHLPDLSFMHAKVLMFPVSDFAN